MSADPFAQRGYGRGRIPYGERPAVVEVDLQRGLVSHEKVGGAELIQRALKNTARLLHAARQKRVPVIHTVVAWRSDLSDFGGWVYKCRGLLEHITLDSEWAQTEPELLEASDLWLVKKMPSAFHGTPLLQILVSHRVDTLIVTGCTTSGCVRATINDSFSNGFRTIVPEDCVGDQGKDAHDANLADVGRRYAEVTTADEVIGYLRGL